MIQPLAAFLLQGIVSMPVVSTPMSISTPYERAMVAAASVAGTASSTPSIDQAQPASRQTPEQDDITVRRGSKTTQERVPKGPNAK